MTPAKRKSVTTDVACAVGKDCTYTLLMTVCSTSNIGVSSNRWNPRIQSNASKGVRGIQEEPSTTQLIRLQSASTVLRACPDCVLVNDDQVCHSCFDDDLLHCVGLLKSLLIHLHQRADAGHDEMAPLSC